MTYKFGEIGWGEEVSSEKKSTNMKDLFLKLTKGDNSMRIVTSPFQYAMHKYKAPGDKGFGRKVVCSATKDAPECPLCESGDKPKRKWYVGVIDRKTGSYKILDIGWAVFSQMDKLVKNKKWGDIRKYDINIIVDPNGGATGYYTVQPDGGKEPLSAEDQVIVDNIDIEQLKKFSSSPSYKAVEEKLQKINEQFGSAPVPVQAAPAAKGKKGTPVPVADEEEFEDYENN